MSTNPETIITITNRKRIMSFTVVYLIGIVGAFFTFMATQHMRLPVRIGLSIVAFSAISAIGTFVLQNMAR
jgi:hypothetical protein